MLAYLTINDIISIYLFAPIFAITVVGVYIVIGNKFRKVQSTTDINMAYEKSTEGAKSLLILMKRVDDIAKAQNLKNDPDYDMRIKYLNDISESKL
jgi:hypothetical protein